MTPPGSALVVDLAGTYSVSKLELQGDCNNLYRVEGRIDGGAWQLVHELGTTRLSAAAAAAAAAEHAHHAGLDAVPAGQRRR